jgi:hypothetical protein
MEDTNRGVLLINQEGLLIAVWTISSSPLSTEFDMYCGKKSSTSVLVLALIDLLS